MLARLSVASSIPSIAVVDSLPEMKPVSFKVSRRLTARTARQLLSMRGGRNAAKTHEATGWSHQKRIAQISRAKRLPLALLSKLSKIEGKWIEAFGCTLLEYLLLTQTHPDERGHR
jgi:hypothetical protein